MADGIGFQYFMLSHLHAICRRSGIPILFDTRSMAYYNEWRQDGKAKNYQLNEDAYRFNNSLVITDWEEIDQILEESRLAYPDVFVYDISPGTFREQWFIDSWEANPTINPDRMFAPNHITRAVTTAYGNKMTDGDFRIGEDTIEGYNFTEAQQQLIENVKLDIEGDVLSPS